MVIIFVCESGCDGSGGSILCVKVVVTLVVVLFVYENGCAGRTCQRLSSVLYVFFVQVIIILHLD